MSKKVICAGFCNLKIYLTSTSLPNPMCRNCRAILRSMTFKIHKEPTRRRPLRRCAWCGVVMPDKRTDNRISSVCSLVCRTNWTNYVQGRNFDLYPRFQCTKCSIRVAVKPVYGSCDPCKLSLKSAKDNERQESSRIKHNSSLIYFSNCVQCDCVFAHARKQNADARCRDCNIYHKIEMKRKARFNGKVKRKRLMLGAGYEPINRSRVLARDGSICHICSEPINAMATHPDPESFEIDHVIPLSKGGSHTYVNVRASHRRCNAAKSDHLSFNLLEMAVA